MARALRLLGWEPAQLIVARHPVKRLLGMIVEPSPTVAGIDFERPPLVMAFPHCSAVHTCFMRYPLDIAFITGEGEAISVQYRVEPWRFLSCPGALSVLERFST